MFELNIRWTKLNFMKKWFRLNSNSSRVSNKTRIPINSQLGAHLSSPQPSTPLLKSRTPNRCASRRASSKPLIQVSRDKQCRDKVDRARKVEVNTLEIEHKMQMEAPLQPTTTSCCSASTQTGTRLLGKHISSLLVALKAMGNRAQRRKESSLIKNKRTSTWL